MKTRLEHTMQHTVLALLLCLLAFGAAGCATRAVAPEPARIVEPAAAVELPPEVTAPACPEVTAEPDSLSQLESFNSAWDSGEAAGWKQAYEYLREMLLKQCMYGGCRFEVTYENAP